MNLKTQIPTVLFTAVFFLTSGNIYAQSCKKAFLNAQEQYNGGRYKSAQNLLDACIKEFENNKSDYKNSQEQVRKVYELYIDACNKARNTECAKAKRKELNAFFS